MYRSLASIHTEWRTQACCMDDEGCQFYMSVIKLYLPKDVATLS